MNAAKGFRKQCIAQPGAIAAAAFIVLGVTGASAAERPVIYPAAGAEQSTSAILPGEIYAEIHDLATGDRWLLERVGSHPGGPGRLVQVPPGANESQAGTNVRRSGAKHLHRIEAAAPKLVIYAGDRIVVAEDTAVVEARLEAVALASACQGALLKVRLAIGGRIVRVVAQGPSRATLLPEAGERR